MCIILTCNKNVRPDYDLIENCFWSNPDGAGIMWTENGRVETSKGFATPEELMRAINSIPTNAPVVIHMRIATSGGINVGTCHPFPICSDLEILHAADTECSAAIAHNGVIRSMPTNDKMGISDTVSFVSGHLAPMFKGKVTKTLKTQIKQIAPGNRFAILTKDGTVSRIGEGWETVRPGIQASNGSWRYNPLPFGRVTNSFDCFDAIGEYDVDDERYDKLFEQANRIACGDYVECSECGRLGSCIAWGPSCDEQAGLADCYLDSLLWCEENDALSC